MTVPCLRILLSPHHLEAENFKGQDSSLVPKLVLSRRGDQTTPVSQSCSTPPDKMWSSVHQGNLKGVLEKVETPNIPNWTITYAVIVPMHVGKPSPI